MTTMASARSPKVTKTLVESKKSVDRQFVNALARGLAILRCFDATRPQLSITEIAQIIRLPQPTVWRLCYTLQELGYLVQTPNSEKLRVGVGVLGLGQFALVGDDIGDLVGPEMEQLAERSGGAVSLGVIEQSNVLLIRRVIGKGPLSINLQVGSRLPITTSSGGWAYLAALDDDEREKRLQRLKLSYTGKWTALRDAISQEVVQFRMKGFVFNGGFFHRDVNAVGAPILNAIGKVTHVITCGGPALSRKRMIDEIGPRIATLARRVSDALRSRAD
jgi:DNA-binding IclR family transcriptional regulator